MGIKADINAGQGRGESVCGPGGGGWDERDGVKFYQFHLETFSKCVHPFTSLPPLDHDVNHPNQS